MHVTHCHIYMLVTHGHTVFKQCERTQDYTKFQSWIMAVGFKGYGQSPENGAKPLIYACCAPEEDLRGMLLPYQFEIVLHRCVHLLSPIMHPYPVWPAE